MYSQILPPPHTHLKIGGLSKLVNTNPKPAKTHLKCFHKTYFVRNNLFPGEPEERLKKLNKSTNQ